MQTQVNFSYFYGEESEQFSYFRIPRLLVRSKKFKTLSTDAKPLYGLMLDRMGLSAKHSWYDELGRVYIYYTLDEIQTDLMCGHNKAVRLLAELDTCKDGFGLIRAREAGAKGRPAKIYVNKKFTTTDVPETPLSAPVSDFPDSEIQTSQNQTSRLPLLGSQDFPKREASYLDNIYPDLSYPDPSIYPAQAPPDGYDRFDCRKQLYEKLDYEILITEYGETSVKSIIELLTDTLCTAKPSVRIGGEEIPIAAVRERLGQLDRFHITYVLDCMQKTNTPIRNIRAYLLCRSVSGADHDRFLTIALLSERIAAGKSARCFLRPNLGRIFYTHFFDEGGIQCPKKKQP